MISIIYIRTSTEEQNPQNQLKDCLTLIKKLDIKEYEVIEDKQSAWKDDVKRKGFERLHAIIKKSNIEHLIVWDFDRLFRNRQKFKEFLSFLGLYRIKLHSYRQQWLEDLHKIPEPWNEIVYELIVNIYGHIAEDESKKRSERISASIRRKDGVTKSYKGKKWGRRKKPVDVGYILGLRKQGYSMKQIAKMYSDNPKFKSNISHQTVFNIIKKLLPNLAKQKRKE